MINFLTSKSMSSNHRHLFHSKNICPLLFLASMLTSAFYPFPTSPQYFSLICDPFADPIISLHSRDISLSDCHIININTGPPPPPPLRQIGREYSAKVAFSIFQSMKRIQPLPVCAGFFICIRNSLDRPCVTKPSCNRNYSAIHRYTANNLVRLTSYVPWLVPRLKRQINTNLSQWNFYLGDVITIKSLIFFIFNLF